jgi:hypothetical protein
MQTHTVSARDFLKGLSPQDFRVMGLNELAYIRPVKVDGATVFAIHAADGTPLTIDPSFETAYGTIIQNHMFPVVTH